ncbi:hypothetical protein [Bacteroides ovatus]|uniref:hypothetical protein n=1 Tax=Bacteroides ovatus TaxID=28116 RepID=UPI00189800F7|nr:hypothetical protein [Bacteroides ovatus]MDC2622339.1 hypothetical protein [Bacteroides ovatus]MDC2635337.1 hypothetical protein [Bacteroides ovatus]MDC2649768.1 hypothetical protein [Bacteroides ovatus]
MKRIEGTSGVKLIECVNPVKQKWRIRWDVQEKEDGSANYMEEEFLGQPSPEEIKSIVIDWYNKQIEKAILSGFVYENMPVWLSTENQFNYKVVYDLAVQTNGATLPVVFKFGTDEQVQYHIFGTLEELTDFYTKAMKYVQDTLTDGWEKKDAFNLELYRVE